MTRSIVRSTSVLLSLLLILMILAACGGDEPEPTAEPPAATATAVPTIAAEATEEPEETPAAEAPAASEEMTGTEEVSEGDDITGTEEVSEGEEMTDTEEVSEGDDITGTEEVSEGDDITGTEEVSEGDDITGTEEVSEGEEMTDTSSSESAPVTAAAAPITVVSDREITEVLNEEWPYFATVSPDGTSIIYATQDRRERSLCVFTFDNAAVQCFTPPEEFQDYPYNLQWSPDSKLVALTENPLQLGNESDIWIIDAAAGTMTNITDDGVTGYYSQDEPGSYTLDYLPMWNAADGMLYFWRSVTQGDLTMTRDLMKIDPAGGEPEAVRDIAGQTGTTVIVFDSEDWYLDGVSSISPDGSKVAALITEPMDPYNSPSNGLWIVDITTPDATPEQMMTMEDFQSASAPFQNMPTVPVGLAWTADSNGLIALGFSEDTHSPLHVFYYIDTSTGEVTPVVDFSQVPDLETLYGEVDEAGFPMRYYSPWTATLSPSRTSLLMYNDLGGVPGMMQAMLPPDGSKPVAIFKGDYSSTGVTTRSSTSEDGKVLIYGQLLTVEEE